MYTRQFLREWEHGQFLLFTSNEAVNDRLMEAYTHLLDLFHACPPAETLRVQRALCAYLLQIERELHLESAPPDGTCGLCLDASPDPPTLWWSTLPCGHLFHRACLATWMRVRTTCPQCALPVEWTEYQRQPQQPDTLEEWIAQLYRSVQGLLPALDDDDDKEWRMDIALD
jgi:hypothetical protein